MVAYLQLQLIGDSIRKHEHWMMPLSYWLSPIHLCLGFHTHITGELFQFLSLNSEWLNRGRLNVPISRNIDQRLWSIRYPVELFAAFLSPLSDACLVLSYELCDFWKTKIQTETAQLFWGTNSCSVCYLRRKQYVRIRQQHSMEPILCIHECLDQCTISKPATERKLIRRTKLPKKKGKSDQVYEALCLYLCLLYVFLSLLCSTRNSHTYLLSFILSCWTHSGGGDGQILCLITIIVSSIVSMAFGASM